MIQTLTDGKCLMNVISADTPRRQRAAGGGRAALLGIAALLLALVACDDTTPPPLADSRPADQQASPDQGLVVDAPVSDAFIWPDVKSDAPLPDLPPPDLAPAPTCSMWPDWKSMCYQQGLKGCEALCKDAKGLFRKITCKDDGSCSCTVSGKTSSCSKVTASSVYCQTCINALIAGCCKP